MYICHKYLFKILGHWVLLYLNLQLENAFQLDAKNGYFVYYEKTRIMPLKQMGIPAKLSTVRIEMEHGTFCLYSDALLAKPT